MLEADIERQLTLESYGYRFLRINRFNLGKDPVQTLSDRLARLIDHLTDDDRVASVERMQEVAAGLASKELKTCSRCNEIKPQEAFFDRSLKGGEGGHGRVCTACKAKAEKTMTQRRPRTPGRRRAWRRWR
jgi:hypothetical protein